MKFSLAALTALVLAATPALSTIVITQPVASTTVKGGKHLNVEWKDDGKTPKLSSDWGGVNIYLAAGSQDVQFKLQRLASNVAVTETQDKWKVDPDIGPSGPYYFIRMEGTKAGSNGIPPMAFSARFTLNHMSGKFNSTVMAAAKGKEGSASSSSSLASTSTFSVSRSATPVSAAQTSPPSSGSGSGGSSAAGALSPVSFSHAAMAAGALTVGALTLL